VHIHGFRVTFGGIGCLLIGAMNDCGELPSKISSFVDLSQLPEDAGISCGGVQQLSLGMYAIVESVKFLTNVWLT
jgi:hypothetical protein